MYFYNIHWLKMRIFTIFDKQNVQKNCKKLLYLTASKQVVYFTREQGDHTSVSGFGALVEIVEHTVEHFLVIDLEGGAKDLLAALADKAGKLVGAVGKLLIGAF